MTKASSASNTHHAMTLTSMEAIITQDDLSKMCPTGTEPFFVCLQIYSGRQNEGLEQISQIYQAQRSQASRVVVSERVMFVRVGEG